MLICGLSPSPFGRPLHLRSGVLVSCAWVSLIRVKGEMGGCYPACRGDTIHLPLLCSQRSITRFSSPMACVFMGCCVSSLSSVLFLPIVHWSSLQFVVFCAVFFECSLVDVCCSSCSTLRCILRLRPVFLIFPRKRICAFAAQLAQRG